MVCCSSCCVPAGGSGEWSRQSGKGTRRVTTHEDVHERLFVLSRRRKCTCQAPLRVDEDDSDDNNCTFTPAINRTHEALLARWAEGVTVFERLYGNALYLQRRRQQLQESMALERGYPVRSAFTSRSWSLAAAPQPESVVYEAPHGVTSNMLVKSGTRVRSPLCLQEKEQRGRPTRATMRT
ncbi:hypothetical protein TraAM80_06218 [Trypanosoma rangeli]|uniref:Uncharacterized protein n=1 Tax=Trypanosoma rangeli TaxID=5698 RepID=A0A422NB86_TRYRA|nr:uncharacterized protein TraAM80_06218 [Trypanosoma rangeli]RNF02696.1 hypothetical protein TraAM80_06218 [Trypanosoma rangeli]|eukprot:RNF02696.1 hypothetical protein TraAM80_06218 [Trypanosoma rangeli]